MEQTDQLPVVMPSVLTIRKDEDMLNWLVIVIKTGERLNCDIWRVMHLRTSALSSYRPEISVTERIEELKNGDPVTFTPHDERSMNNKNN